MRLERVPWLPLAVGPYTSTFRHLPNFVDDENLRAQTTHLRQDCSHKSNTVYRGCPESQTFENA